MRIGGVVTLLFVSVFLSAGCREKPKGSARELGQQAYQTVVEHPYETAKLRTATEQLDQARSLDPNESWVLLASAMFEKNRGYRSGDWALARSFDPSALSRAKDLTERAIAADNSVIEAHIELGWLHIIGERWGDAHREFTTVHEMDKMNFDSWYGEAVNQWMGGDEETSERMLKRAEFAAQTLRHKKRLLIQKERMARSRGDVAEVESILKRQISLAPDYAWAYGNYGLFLLRHERYDEAIANYEKAIALQPYGLAVKQLEEAKRKRAGK